MSAAAQTPPLVQPLPEHLRRLESKAIGIMREVAAEFRKPVMLCSIGKDSSVMVHLARKAFYPGKPPFPLPHIDAGGKLLEVTAFREKRCGRRIDSDEDTAVRRITREGHF